VANLDEIVVCSRCLHPVEGYGISCPRCYGDLWSHFPSPLLQTLRVLKAKGWVVEKWNVKMEKDGPFGFVVRLTFVRLAPPLPVFERQPLQGRWNVNPELPDYTRPTVLVFSTDMLGIEAYQTLHLWAMSAPSLSLPFAQIVCDKCKQQGGDWFFSSCNCPLAEKKFVRFADGLPDGCYYAAEQVVTEPGRAEHLRRFFDEHKIAHRILSRRV